MDELTATEIVLHLPGSWVECDPRAPDLVEELRRMVAVPAGARDAAVDLLAPLALELRRTTVGADVVLVGFYADAVEIEGAADPFVVTANVTLAISPPVAGIEGATAALRDAGADVAPVDLPAGRGVLATGVTTVTGESWEGEVTARTRRYLVPVPGSDRMAALSFLTPNLDLAGQLDEVFDAIAHTLEFVVDDTVHSPVRSGT
ncbi:hypothetical protein [Pseudonocardia broussonetiae]|uniref:Uncharacterized protein n=1 Tax=Pseudonocardia broussonetiae TaxID=2736640 RepID=A0A6M6JIS6_9PSEU|nr:hypothetical protein [Pseudonocardia broussonetiae]QJY47938.1 hypothetical protein HOP40_20820 [Pseudonocardia broussonetiae]